MKLEKYHKNTDLCKAERMLIAGKIELLQHCQRILMEQGQSGSAHDLNLIIEDYKKQLYASDDINF